MKPGPGPSRGPLAHEPTHQPEPWVRGSFQTLAALPDQDSFYDVTDALEQQGMEALVQRLLGTAGTDVDLRTQLMLYEVGLVGMGGEAQFPSACPLYQASAACSPLGHLHQSALRLEDGDMEEAAATAAAGGRRERRKPSSEEGKRSRRSLEGGGCPVRAPEPG